MDEGRMSSLFESRRWNMHHLRRIWSFICRRKARDMSSVLSASSALDVPKVVAAELGNDAHFRVLTTKVSAALDALRRWPVHCNAAL
jgi:hypothetical protein